MAAIALAVAVEVVLPLLGAVYFWRRRDGTFLTFLTGVLGFYLSQPLLRIPLLNGLGSHAVWFSMLRAVNPVGYLFLLAFTAGLFEESARWAGMRLLRKGRTSWMDAFAYGLGHGGCEAAWLFFSQILPACRSGSFSPAGAALGAAERFFTMMVQIGLTFVVVYGLQKRRLWYLLLAVALHTAVDFQLILGNVWLLEGLIALEGIGAMAVVFWLKKRKKREKKENAL